MAEADLLWVVGILTAVAVGGWAAYKLGEKGDLSRTRRLVRIENVAGFFAFMGLFVWRTGVAVVPILVFGGILAALLGLSTLLTKFCTACGHREMWSRFGSSPKFCSYCGGSLRFYQDVVRTS